MNKNVAALLGVDHAMTTSVNHVPEREAIIGHHLPAHLCIERPIGRH
jgi:hypothetical protein